MADTTRFATVNRLEAPATLLNGPAVVVGAIGQWANGSANIGRAAGSWIADGVKPWSLLGGTLATKFPGSTRVQSVGPTTLVMTNPASAGGSGTDSGSFTPTFALAEDPDFPTSNLIYPKRYVPFHSAASPSPLELEYDLGSNLNCDHMAVLCADTLDAIAGVGVLSVSVSSGTTYGSYTLRGTATMVTPYRDAGVVFSDVSARFWKFAINCDTDFSLGGLWLGDVNLDLGLAYWPGSSFKHEDNESKMYNGAMEPAYFRRGAPHRSMRLDLNGIPDALHTSILNVFIKRTRCPLLIDKDDKFWEVVLVDSRIEWVARFNNLQALPLEVETLP